MPDMESENVNKADWEWLDFDRSVEVEDYRKHHVDLNVSFFIRHFSSVVYGVVTQFDR